MRASAYRRIPHRNWHLTVSYIRHSHRTDVYVCVRAPDVNVACVCARRRVDKRGRMMQQLQVNVIRD